ncbi:hypothetical protein [Herminiimonas sp. CN]|uniref:hypothetical protein n=1 Tax=Herminiimonas sp. CN TaxID=1349818 RepID=UPI00054EA129|nr:hypothetical protein [Herminiimonas sp. CN]
MATKKSFAINFPCISRMSDPVRLQKKRRVKHAFQNLPFVAGSRSVTETPYWSVSASGGYFGGYETGAAMAQSFLKFLREDKGEFASHHLTGIIESFMVRFEQEGGLAMKNMGRMSEWSDGFSGFRGQYTGFFNTIADWLTASAKHLGGNLDRLTEQDLVRKANAGLNFDEAAYMASLDSEVAA